VILHERQQRIVFIVLFAFVIGTMGLLVLPLWRYLVWGSIIGVMLVPVRRWVQDRIHTRPGIVSALVYVFFVLVVITPFILVLAASGDQAGNVAETAKTTEIRLAPLNSESVVSGAASWFDDAQTLVQWLFDGIMDVFTRIVDEITDFIGSAIQLFIKFILFSFFLVVFMHSYEQIRDLLLRLIPLPQEVSTVYLHKSRVMSRDVVIGVFGVAAVQTTIMLITFYLVGIPNTLAFLIPLYLFALIPFLGMSLITIPLGIYLIMQGQVVPALVIWGVHLIAINNVELVLRPVIISKEVRVNRALLATSFFGGMAIFGLTGLFVGPILCILLVISIDIYQANFLTPERPVAVQAE
jgi:predicted PurR-regulated permease PerM